MTTLHDPSSFPTEHPLHVCAPVADKPTEDEIRLFEQSDLILSFGWHDLAGFLKSRTGTSQIQAPLNVPIVHCSQESSLANGWSMDYQALPPVDVPVLTSPDTLVRALLTSFQNSPQKAKVSPVLDNFTHWSEIASRVEITNNDKTIDINLLASTLSEFAQSHNITFARLPIGWPGNQCRFEGPMDYLGKDGGGAVGTGPGHTIGSALALKNTDKCVVGVIGDGDFLMGVNALWTASHMEIPLKIVVANNRSYFNDEVHQERMAIARDRPVKNKWIGQKLDDPPIDISALAKAQGFDVSGPVDNIGRLSEALLKGHKIVNNGGRYLIDANIVPGYS